MNRSRMNNDKNFDLILKRIAWVCLSAAGISIVGLAGFFYREMAKHSSRREVDRVRFEVKVDTSIRSFAKAKILVNGVVTYVELEKDTTGTLTVYRQLKNGFRPTGNVEAKIYTVGHSAIEVRINFKEGFNPSTRYVASPTLIDCDSLCKDYAKAYVELDSLKSRTARLSEAILILSPNHTIDTQESCVHIDTIRMKAKF